VPRVLILFAHPAYHRSRANRALVEAVRGLDGVTFHDLYEAYPDLTVDVPHEQGLLESHGAVVFQHPFFWYSAPALVKEWLDLVLTHGWAYGEGGTALEGKSWLTAITSGGSETSYAPEGGNRWTVEEFLRPFEATAILCGMRWRTPFVLHASHLVSAVELVDTAAAYRARVLALREEGAP
jgi:glutathione-regulated potassium-efflux system ancillary protein KefG